MLHLALIVITQCAINSVASTSVSASRDDQGRLPLHWAAASGSAALAQVLLDAAHTAMAKDRSPRNGEAEQADPLDGIPVTEARVILPTQLSSCLFPLFTLCRLVPFDEHGVKNVTCMHMQDKQGNTALHLGARSRCPELLSVLLQGGGSAAAHIKNHDGQLPLHVAAKAGHVDGVKALMQAEPSTIVIKDLRGMTAQDWAAKRGHQVRASRKLHYPLTASWLAFTDVCLTCWQVDDDVKSESELCLPWHAQDVVAAFGNAECNGHASSHPAMLLVAPVECHMHNTCPFPILRGSRPPPPENINRLHVLTDSGKPPLCRHSAPPKWQYLTMVMIDGNGLAHQLVCHGLLSLCSGQMGSDLTAGGLDCGAELGILRSEEFADLQWETRPPHARISDILRVHEWSYVRELQTACAALNEHDLGHLDGDTAISAGSFRAAMAAAGAVIAAVDRVVRQEVS